MLAAVHALASAVVSTVMAACVLLQRAQDGVHLLSLAVLLSSTFVFNQMGPIDEAALDKLSLVTQITRHIRVRATGPAVGVHCAADVAAVHCSAAPYSTTKRQYCQLSAVHCTWRIKEHKSAAAEMLGQSRH